MIRSSKVERAAAGIAEAAIVLAAVSLPLYFTALSENGYEAEKSILLRILAVVAGAAFLLSGSLRPLRAPRLRSFDPLVASAVLVFAIYAVATVVSIDPRLSMFGSFQRQQGLWTHAAYLILFVVAAGVLRDAVRRERFVTLLLIGSIPVVAYGLVQTIGIDPLPAAGDPNTLHWPVRSTLGQHVFLGSYLVMILPLTLMQAVWSWKTPRTGSAGIPREALDLDDVATAVAGIGVMLVSFFVLLNLGNDRPALYAVYPAFLGCYAFVGLLWWRVSRTTAGSRLAACGYALLAVLQLAVLGASGARGAWLGTAAAMAAFFLLLAWRARRADLWPAILAACVIGGIFLVLLNIPGGPLQPLRTRPGLSRLANITDSGGAGGSAQGRILIWQGVGTLMTTQPSIGGTWGGPGRLLIGYGPESMHWAFQAVFPLKLRQVTSEIWTWDRAHNIFLDNLVDAGVLGLAAMLAAFAVFLLRVVVGSRSIEGYSGLLLVGSGAAVVGHIVDGVFGLETPVTLALLWLLFSTAMPERAVKGEEADEDLRPGAVLSGVLVVATAALTTWAGAQDYPVLMAALTVASALAGTLALAAAFQPGMFEFTFAPVRRTLPVVATLVVAVLALGAQLRFEAANVAERDGLARLGAAQAQSAVSYFQQATLENGYEPQFYTDLGGAYLTLFSTRVNDSGPPVAATGDAARTVSQAVVGQLSRFELLDLSQASLQAGQNLAPLDPDNAYNRGNVLVTANRVNEALQQYRLAEKLSKDNPRYLDQTAYALLRAGRVNAAAAWARRGLQLDTTFWYSHYMASLVAHQQGAHSSARSEASLALYWIHNYWPPPAQSQVNELQRLAQAG